MELTALSYPEQYGGSGASLVDQAIVAEELARGCVSTSLQFLISKLGMLPVINFGSHELKSKYIPRICSGESQCSYGLSEPDAGSDVASMTTKAVADGDSWIISGTKCWITNAGISDLYTVFARTSSDRHKGITAFLVEADWGVQVDKLEHKLGIKGSPTGVIVPTSGSVHLGGVDLRALGERGRATLRRESVGIVFQYGTLVPELTGEENVALPLLLSGQPRREAIGQAREWLGRLGVDSVGATTAARMSGGERQRVALARALVVRPRVVLADEPTGALDSVASDLVATELVAAARDAGAAVVLVTHDARVAAHADREVHLWDGQVDADVPLDVPGGTALESEVVS